MKVGDYVQVKDGVLDPEYNKYDFTGFRGIITEVQTTNKPNEETLIGIEWDIATLNKMPKEYIAIGVEGGYDIGTMYLGESDFILLSEKCEDKPQDRTKLISQLEEEGDLASSPYGEILGLENGSSVNANNLSKYRTCLVKKLSKPITLTGREGFPWEEKYFFGYGSKEEYEELKKTNPSHTDTYEFVKILPSNFHPHDLFVKVKRVSDKKQFELGLSWLKCADRETDNIELLDHFASWVVNYQ